MWCPVYQVQWKWKSESNRLWDTSLIRLWKVLMKVWKKNKAISYMPLTLVYWRTQKPFRINQNQHYGISHNQRIPKWYIVTAPTRSVSERVLFLVVSFTLRRFGRLWGAFPFRWRLSSSGSLLGDVVGSLILTDTAVKCVCCQAPFWLCEKISVNSKTVIKNDIWEWLE